MRLKQNGALEFTARLGYSLFVDREGRELMFVKYFKILLVSKPYYLKQQDSH